MRKNFSVSMCVYGGDDSAHFDEALESVYNQSRMPDEVVLVVDGPIPDSTENIIQKYTQLYGMRVFRHSTNMGHGAARATALQQCINEYVAIADADDINAPNRFEVQMRMMEEDETLSAVSSGCYHFTSSTTNITNEECLPEAHEEIIRYMKYRCPLCQASAVLKKKDVEKAGGYLEWYHAEDYYLWLRMFLNKSKFANAGCSLIYVRSDPEQIQRRGGYKYFLSMKNLFYFMYKEGIINLPTLIYNCLVRFIIQVIFPNRIRAYLRKKTM